jgi:phospholipase/carboxylesterase
MAILAGPQWGPAAGGAAKQLVVLCHGLGADGHDLIELAPYFAKGAPHALFVAPDAPEPCDMAPMGRQWFSLRDLDPDALAVGVLRGAKTLAAFIDAQLTRLGISDYALMGFSQGAMTVLFEGVRHAPPPKAVLAYSGALIAPDALLAEMTARPPMLIAHGEDDEVVPPFRSRDAAAALRAAGFAVETIFSPGLGHSMDEAGLAAGAALLAKVFGGEM